MIDYSGNHVKLLQAVLFTAQRSENTRDVTARQAATRHLYTPVETIFDQEVFGVYVAEARNRRDDILELLNDKYRLNTHVEYTSPLKVLDVKTANMTLNTQLLELAVLLAVGKAAGIVEYGPEIEDVNITSHSENKVKLKSFRYAD